MCPFYSIFKHLWWWMCASHGRKGKHLDLPIFKPIEPVSNITLVKWAQTGFRDLVTVLLVKFLAFGCKVRVWQLELGTISGSVLISQTSACTFSVQESILNSSILPYKAKLQELGYIFCQNIVKTATWLVDICCNMQSFEWYRPV